MFFDKRIRFLYSDESVYQSEEPVFYDPSDYPVIQEIEDRFPEIIHELKPYLDDKVFINTNNPNAPGTNYPDTWKHAYFMNYLWAFKQTQKLFPFTYSIFKSHKEITLAGIASLEPGGKLFSHVGETNAIIRCHLGLKIPGVLPECGLRVKDQFRSWEEGKTICFNDAFNHEAWNNTPHKRFIIIFDILRPEFAKYKYRICAYSLGIATSRYILQIMGIKMLSIPLRKAIILPFAVVWYFYLRVQDIFLNGSS